MAKPILVANWKNHPGSLPEAKVLLRSLSRSKDLYRRVSLFIAPPAPYLDAVSSRIKGFANLASQDFFPDTKGSQTGALTPEILKSFGTRLAIVGHSERRALGETSAQVSEKAKSALRNGVVPVICVGEFTRDADGEHFEFLRVEIKDSLGGLSAKAASKVILAYEPAWAIGKSSDSALPPHELSESIIFIRKQLSDLYGRKVAENIPVLYGGAVEAGNAAALLASSGARGLLVGHASLDPGEFAEIARNLVEK